MVFMLPGNLSHALWNEPNDLGYWKPSRREILSSTEGKRIWLVLADPSHLVWRRGDHKTASLPRSSCKTPHTLPLCDTPQRFKIMQMVVTELYFGPGRDRFYIQALFHCADREFIALG